MFVGFLEAYGIGVPIGGSGKLTDALVACIRDKGGEVLAGVDIDSVIVKQGRAVGARAKDGRDFQAKDAVIGAIHPHHLAPHGRRRRGSHLQATRKPPKFRPSRASPCTPR